MQPTQTRHQDDIRLRFVFNSRVVSIDRATDPTYWEIAETLDDLRDRYGEPIAIDVFTGSRGEEPLVSPLSRFRPTMA